MRKIIIYDTTLRDGEQTPSVNFSASQKLNIAKRLAKAGVDVIEAGFPASSKADFTAVKMISEGISESTVSALARMTKGDIDCAAEALASAKRSRLHIFIATSDIHLKNKLKITREEAIEKIKTCTTYAKELGVFSEIEFSAEDATRTDPEFLCRAIRCAADCGAEIINIPDTVGYTTPDEYSELIRLVCKTVPECSVSTHCHNDLGLATANTLAAIRSGATQGECTINGLGERAGNASLEEIVMAIRVRGGMFSDAYCGVNTKELTGLSRFVESLSGISVSPNKAIVGRNAFAHSSGIHQHGVMQARETYEIIDPEDVGLNKNTIVLSKLSGRHAYAERVKNLGYSLSPEGVDASFARFKEIAGNKSVVTDEEIRAIVGEYLDLLEGIYTLSSFQIQSGNHMKSMALLTLKERTAEGEHEEITEAAPGEGPVDAAFNAINRISGADGAVELVSYGITAVTEGTDALGEAKVKIKAKDVIYTGRGVSTDIIKASIKAYLGAINKWKNQENEK